jgi:preprotein translocase SecE subunit
MSVSLNYFKESWKELGKITWPTRKQAVRLTVAVAVFSIIFGAFMGAIDYGFAELAKRVFIKG